MGTDFDIRRVKVSQDKFTIKSDNMYVESKRTITKELKMAKSTEKHSIRRMVTFVGTHTYGFVSFKSAKGYDENGHYNYEVTFKEKDENGNIVEGNKATLTSIFNKDKFYVIVDSTKGLTIRDVERLNAFGECLKRNLKGHQQDGRDFDIVFENDKVVEKNGTISIEARKSTKADLKGECLSERKAGKTEAEKDAAQAKKLEAKLAALKAKMAANSAK